MKSENLLIISKSIVKAFSLLEIAIPFHSAISSDSLGFFAMTFLPTISYLYLFPSIWPGNSKSNGGLPSKFLKHKTFESIKEWVDSKKSKSKKSSKQNGLTLKNPNPKNLQNKLLFGPLHCLDLFLSLKLHKKPIFRQILPTKST